MKKCTTIVLSLVLCLVMILSACGEVNTVASIAFPAGLKTTYEVGEKLEAFDITVTMKDGTTATIKSTDAELKITGFDTSKVGSGKLVATYKGATVEANYTVVAKVEIKNVTAASDLGSTGGNYKLTADVLDFAWTITSGKTEIDLNGHKLNQTVTVNGAELVIKDTSENKTGLIVSNNQEGLSTYNGAVVTVNGGKIQGTYWGIVVRKNCKLTVNGGIITCALTTGVAITGNGSNNNGTVITINGGQIIGDNGCSERPGNTLDGGLGIYHPQSGTLNITGGTISGYDGINMKGGTLNISGGIIQSTGEFYEGSGTYGNGSENKGCALTITSNNSYAGNIIVSITGGKLISSPSGYALYENCSAGSTSSVTKIEITGGEFEVASGYHAVAILTARSATTILLSNLDVVYSLS